MMTNDTSMASMNERSWFDRFRTQRNRRGLAIFYVANLGAMLLVSWLVDSYLPLIPLGALYVASTIALMMSTRGITGENANSLDEHQVAFRNASYKTSYWFGTGIAFAGGALVTSISDWDTAFEVGLFVAIWGVVTGLPAMVVAWTLPPEVVDDEE